MRKGQFFMIGLVLLATIIFGVVGLRGSAFISGDTTSNIRNYFKQGIDEFPHAVEQGLKDDYSAENLETSADSYMDFMRYTNSQRGLSAKYVFVTGLEEGDEFNLVVGNYWQTELDLNVSLDGEKEILPNFEPGTTEILRFNPSGKVHNFLLGYGNYTEEFKVYGRTFSFIRGFSDRRESTWIYKKVSN